MSKKVDPQTALKKAKAAVRRKEDDLSKSKKRYRQLQRTARTEAAKELARRDQIVGQVLREQRPDLYQKCLVQYGEEPETIDDEATDQKQPETKNTGEEAQPQTGDQEDTEAKRVVDIMRQNRAESENARDRNLHI